MPARHSLLRPARLPLADVLGHGVSDRRIDILRRIGEVGSISEAARAAGLSYKAAWQALETLANLAGVPLVEKAVGGSGGGGARLTLAGQQVLHAAETLQRARAQALADLDSQTAGRLGAAAPRAALALRTSMRNQLPCQVLALRPVQGQVRVHLHLADGLVLNARITRESAQLLGLRPGVTALALCKATAVVIMAAAEAEADGHNRLPGRVTRAPRAAGEVGLQLAPDLHLVGFAGAGHGLRTGLPALARVDESAVVLALPG
jgi:molybdate transport system regulatory protein